MIDVTVENFETEVIAASQSVPVLVDFWAPWCGPCKSLGPVLEKLETDYGGRFKLVKVNSDDEQELASAFGIRSLPTCVLLINGQPVDGFMGAQPEGKVREFLDKHVPAGAEAEPEIAEEEEEAPVEEDAESILEKFRHALAADPADDGARFGYVKALMTAGRSDDAKVAFAPVIAKAALDRRLDALQRWMKADDFAQGGADIAALEVRIAADRRDFGARFDRAQLLMAQQAWTAAMDELLEILMRDKGWSEDLARKTYIAILEIIQPPAVKVADGQVPPEDATVAGYRRRLSSVVLS